MTDSVVLVPPTPQYRETFLEAVAQSRSLHTPWVSPPNSVLAYSAYLRRAAQPNFDASLILSGSGGVVGVVNLSEIVMGSFCSAYMGYYGFAKFTGRGLMRRGLEAAVVRAFGPLGLHRVEANVQPENLRSRRLVERCRFKLEGYSPRYLKIGGVWKDHERWALTREDWSAAQP